MTKGPTAFAYLPNCSALCQGKNNAANAAIQRLKSFDPFAAPFSCLGLFFLLLNARFIIETPLLDLGKESFFGQLSLKVFDRLFDLIVTNNHFHIYTTFLSLDGPAKPRKARYGARAGCIPENKKSTSVVPEMLFPA